MKNSLTIIKEFLDEAYGFDISNTSRKRKYCYAKKVFCKLAFETNRFKCLEVAKEIGLTNHTTYLYHCKTFDVVFDKDKEIYKYAKMMLGSYLYTINEKSELMKSILEHLKELDYSQLKEFYLKNDL